MPEQIIEAFSRGYTGQVDDVDASRRWVVARVNTDAVDQFQTVVDPAGMDRSDYLRNPVVLWDHGKDKARGKVPIGKNAWMKARGKTAVLAKTVFADDEFSRGLFALYRDGFLSAWSINGLPTNVGPPTPAEIQARPVLRSAKLIYRSWKLTEYSAVPVPGNADCLTEEVSRGLRAAVERGLWIPDQLRAQLPPLVPVRTGGPLPPLVVYRTRDEALESIERRSREIATVELMAALKEARELARGMV